MTILIPIIVAILFLILGYFTVKAEKENAIASEKAIETLKSLGYWS